MRKCVVLSLTFLLVLFVAGAANAKHHTTSHEKYTRMHGDIESVDSTGGTFTVKHGGEDSTFKTDSSTKFKGAGKSITFADLKPGDDVRVSYTMSGTDKVAARVDVAHGKKSYHDPCRLHPDLPECHDPCPSHPELPQCHPPT